MPLQINRVLVVRRNRMARECGRHHGVFKCRELQYISRALCTAVISTLNIGTYLIFWNSLYFDVAQRRCR